MGKGLHCSAMTVLLLLLLVVTLAHTDRADAYQNFTVGDSEGWTSQPVDDYATWANGKNFSLGDYLIFKYTTDYNVIVTYNASVYKSCDYLDAGDDDYEVWGEAGVSTRSEIPLVRVGATYFFCGTNNSFFCLEGKMKFWIDVSQGDGLPPSLLVPPPSAPAPSPSIDGVSSPSSSSPPSPPNNLASANQSSSNSASTLTTTTTTTMLNRLPYVAVALVVSCFALLPLGLL